MTRKSKTKLRRRRPLRAAIPVTPEALRQALQLLPDVLSAVATETAHGNLAESDRVPAAMVGLAQALREQWGATDERVGGLLARVVAIWWLAETPAPAAWLTAHLWVVPPRTLSLSGPLLEAAARLPVYADTLQFSQRELCAALSAKANQP